MASEKLFELAFAYKKTKLWQKLWDSQLFAVKLSDNRMGYVCIMGIMGEHRAVAVYIGEDGLNSYRTIQKAERFEVTDLSQEECMLCQDCLQCVFESKNDLHPEELEEVRSYARSHGVRLAGKCAYPVFLRYRPYRIPWQPEKQEEETLCQGLEAAIEMARLLENKRPDELGLVEINEKQKEILMLEKRDGEYVLGKTCLPKEREKKWPEPRSCNDIYLASIKKFKKKGTWECELVRMTEPVQDDPEEVPVFPMMFLIAESGSGYVLPIMPVKNYEEEPEKLLDLLLETLVKQKICPKKLKVQDERTFAFLKWICERLGIGLSTEKSLPDLDDIKYEFLDEFSMDDEDAMDELVQMMKMLETVPKEEIPEMVLRQLDILKEQNFLDALLPGPEKPSLPKAAKPALPGKEDTEAKSYVISVSLGTGCYRHIRISGNCTLQSLHETIVDSFGFFDDHAHAFFMDNKAWSNRDSYYADMAAEQGERVTGKYRLNQLGLYKGKAFKYVFDFGDEWMFQCKVLRTEDKDAGEAVVIKSKGEAPPQYGEDLDEDDF